jgi:hypothetical protein
MGETFALFLRSFLRYNPFDERTLDRESYKLYSTEGRTPSDSGQILRRLDGIERIRNARMLPAIERSTYTTLGLLRFPVSVSGITSNPSGSMAGWPPARFLRFVTGLVIA